MSALPPPAAGRKKTVHRLDTPFSTVSWPEISLDDQATILELLCNLLAPVGQHRRTHTKPSKGKRAARRRASSKADADGPPSVVSVAPKPELCEKVDVGFNSITRKLEGLSHGGQDHEARRQSYSMMIGIASQALPRDEKTRLVGFSKPCAGRLSSSLGITRTSSVAVARDAPGAEALWAFVQKTVAPVDISWLDDLGGAKYRATKISSVETTVGNKKAKTS